MQQRKRKPKRPRREDRRRPLNFLLLNAPHEERLRLYNEHQQEDVTIATLSALLADLKQVEDIRLLLESIDGALDLKQKTRPAVTEAWATLRSVGRPLVALYQSAFARHAKIRGVLRPTSSDVVFHVWRISWLLLCRVAVLVAQAEDMVTSESGFEWWPIPVAKKAASFPYVAAVGNRHMQLALTDEPIGAYSVRTLMTSMHLLCESLDAYGWTPSAGEYLQALFLRYALILHDPVKYAASNDVDVGRWEGTLDPNAEGARDTLSGPAAGGGADQGEAANMDTDVSVEGAAVLYARAQEYREPLLAPAKLRTAFLDVAERLFFHHIWRDHGLQDCWRLQLGTSRSVLWGQLVDAKRGLFLGTSALVGAPFFTKQQRWAAWRLNKGLPALSRLLKNALQSPTQAQSIVDYLQAMYPARLIWPGEADQMAFEYPDEAEEGDPFGILFRLRIDHYKRMQATLHFDHPERFVDEYVAQEAKFCRMVLAQGDVFKTPQAWAEWVVTIRLGVEPERIVLLLAECVLDKQLERDTDGELTNVFVKNCYVDERLLRGEQGRPAFSLSGWVEAARTRLAPVLAAVWLNYIVLPPGPMAEDARQSSTLVTPHLVDAIAAWFTFARHSPRLRSELKDADFCSAGFDDLELPSELLARPPTW